MVAWARHLKGATFSELAGKKVEVVAAAVWPRWKAAEARARVRNVVLDLKAH